LEEIPISRWDFDQVQTEMLLVLQKPDKNKRRFAVFEDELQQELDKKIRPWFVMQNKGDLMSSIAFLYNYLVLFANKDLMESHVKENNDPFHDKCGVVDGRIADPLRPGVDIKTVDDPSAVVKELQDLVSYINPQAKIECTDSRHFSLSLLYMKSVSDGYLSLTRAGVHFGQTIQFDVTNGEFSAYS
jgi:hypothetical protein